LQGYIHVEAVFMHRDLSISIENLGTRINGSAQLNFRPHQDVILTKEAAEPQDMCPKYYHSICAGRMNEIYDLREQSSLQLLTQLVTLCFQCLIELFLLTFPLYFFFIDVTGFGIASCIQAGTLFITSFEEERCS
jgi:hypothetical protein